MATFDSTNIQFTYVVPAASYSYSGMPLSEALPEASQVQVRFEETLVYVDGTEGSGAAAVAVSDLPVQIQELIRVLPDSMYVLDKDNDSVTVSALGDTEIVIPASTTSYFRPAAAAISGTTPLVLRRSTDIDDAVVTYAPGSRLTSNMLNASTVQLLHASQELTAFGVAGSGGSASTTPDLSGNVLWDIGNVDAPTGNGPITWDGSSFVTGSSGTFVPNGGAEHNILRKATAADGSLEWYDLETNTIAPINTAIGNMGAQVTALEDKTAKQTRTSPGGVPTTEFSGDVTTTVDSVTGLGGDINAAGDLNLSLEGTINWPDPTSAGLNTGPMGISQDVDAGSGTGSIHVDMGGTSQGGGGSVAYKNGDGETVSNLNATGYQYWYAPGEGGSAGRYVLLDPQAGSTQARIKIQQAPNRYIDNLVSSTNSMLTIAYDFAGYEKARTTVDASSSEHIIQRNQDRYINNIASDSEVSTIWRKDADTYTKIQGGSTSPRLKILTGGVTVFNVNNNGVAYTNGVLITSDGDAKNYDLGALAPTSVAEKFKALTSLDTYELLNDPGVSKYGPTIQDLADVGLDITEGMTTEDGTRTLDLTSTVGLLMQAVKELTERIETLEGNN